MRETPVKKGQVLASLDKESVRLSVKLSRAKYYEAAASYRKVRKGYRKEVVKQQYSVYLQASANYKKAKQSYDSAKKLRTSGAISKDQFAGYLSTYRSSQAAKNQAWQSYKMHLRGHQKEDIQTAGSRTSQARTQLAQAKKQLKDTELKAPFSGIIAQKKVEVGELASGGSPSFLLMNMKKIKIRVGVPERVIDQLHHGQKARISFQAGKVAGIGRLERKGFVIDKATLTYPVDVVVDNPIIRYENKKPIYKILPGKIVLILFPRQNAKTGISVPLSAILHDGIKKFVFVAHKGRAKRMTITTGDTYRNELVIKAGLKAGDRVIVEGQHQLSEGSRLFVIGGKP